MSTKAAQAEFDVSHFAQLIAKTAYVSEIGLDGRSRVPMDIQKTTFRAVLSTLQKTPRIASIHSYAATQDVLEELEARPIKGSVLHWWLGNGDQTQRAIEMGCFFSVNAAMLQREANIQHIPIDRLLTETDHPFGDKRSGAKARPGALANVETALARHFALDAETFRLTLWGNLKSVVDATGCASLAPGGVRTQLAALWQARPGERPRAGEPDASPRTRDLR